MASLLVGTTKGLFVLSQQGDGWQVTGPHCDLWPINHAIGDLETGTMWAAGGNDWFGAGVWRSDDGGATWALTKLSTGQLDVWMASDPGEAKLFGWNPPGDVPFAADALTAVWSLGRVGPYLYAGGKPGMLARSADNGTTWEAVTGFTKHPSRDSWNGGAAGLILHSIVADPEDADRAWLGVSAAGVFATEDGGKTWDRRNRLSNAQVVCDHPHPAAPRGGDTGHCVHNMMLASNGVLYQQNHHGVWRSGDGGRSWDDITAGLPSTFGFPVRVHPHDPDMIWTIPLNGDMAGRFPPDAAAAVWRSADGGATWAAQRKGLPQSACYFTVLRQAMAIESSEQPSLYFGTNTGSIFASGDLGESWQEVASHLPTVLSVEAV